MTWEIEIRCNKNRSIAPKNVKKTKQVSRFTEKVENTK